MSSFFYKLYHSNPVLGLEKCGVTLWTPYKGNSENNWFAFKQIYSVLKLSQNQAHTNKIMNKLHIKINSYSVKSFYSTKIHYSII